VSDDATPRLNLPYLAAAQAQKHVTLNEALAALDGLVQTAAVSRTTAAQPGAPADGALYILPEDRIGSDWSLHAPGAVLRFEAGAWSALPLAAGGLVFVQDEGAFLVRAAAGWRELGGALGPGATLERLGVGTQADAANPFAAKLNKLLFTARPAGEGGDGDLRLTLNKESAADVLSLLFQSGYQGRAELGLVGDDRLTLKVAADGVWREAAAVEPGGQLRQPCKPMAQAVLKTGPVTTSDGVFQTLVFDTELLDTSDAYDPATGRFTCPAAGRYRVRLDLTLDSVTPAGAGVEVRLTRNGVQPDRQGRIDKPSAAFSFPQLNAEHLFDCAAGDVLEAQVAGWSGPGVVFGGAGFTQLIVEFLG